MPKINVLFKNAKDKIIPPYEARSTDHCAPPSDEANAAQPAPTAALPAAEAESPVQQNATKAYSKDTSPVRPNYCTGGGDSPGSSDKSPDHGLDIDDPNVIQDIIAKDTVVGVFVP